MNAAKSSGSNPAFPDGSQVPVVPIGTDISPELRQKAIDVTMGGLGKAELETIASYTAPIYWALRNSEGKELIKSGSLFFLDTGSAVFAVTAAHVVMECFEDTKSSMFTSVVIGTNGKKPLRIPLGDRLIDAHEDIDIATFRVTPEELSYIGKTTLRGYQTVWPPRLVEAGQPLTYCGFPGVGRRFIEPRRVLSHGMVPMSAIVANVSDTCISVQIEREFLVRTLGDEEMPENFNFGGMSGGPALGIIQKPNLVRAWKPAGVIFQGPNPSAIENESIGGLEIIRIRPIHFIKADGMLDLDLWAQCNPV